MPAGKRAAKERTQTERIVLRRVNLSGDIEAWEPIGVAVGSKIAAIEHFAGKPGSPDAKPGVYKAPPLSSWRGAAEYVAPDEPKVERRLL